MDDEQVNQILRAVIITAGVGVAVFAVVAGGLWLYKLYLFWAYSIAA